jgi:SAM-dependent methyltransferase
MSQPKRIAASYKDPDSVVFKAGDLVYRQINKSYLSDYRLLHQSGLYDVLTQKQFLLSHREVSSPIFDEHTQATTILPEQLHVITYPHEWSFRQWKDAALRLLEILEISLCHEMILKDATPLNMQMHRGKMVWMDTASFASYEKNRPWIAYRQFCECFLAPLLLMHYNYADAGKLFQQYPNGISMKQLSRLLPFKARFNVHVLMHVYVQASFKGSTKTHQQTHVLRQKKLAAIIDSLKTCIGKLEPRYINFDWDLYYQSLWTSEDYLKEKTNAVERFLKDISIKTAVDIGCNTGYFTRLLAAKQIQVIAADSSASAVDELYAQVCKNNETAIYTCIQDLSSPTPAEGLLLAERDSFFTRAKSDLVVAVALIHHLCIAKNIPITSFLQSLAVLGDYAITEFVPKTDSNVQLMLKNRKDVFANYTQMHFETEAKKIFDIMQQHTLQNGRILYLLRKK